MGSGTERNRIADVVGSSWIHDVFLEADGHSEEGWEGFFLVITISPAFFLGTILSDLVDFLGFLECRFKKLVDNVVIFDSNACCSFDEDEADGIGGVFSFIHEPRQLIGG